MIKSLLSFIPLGSLKTYALTGLVIFSALMSLLYQYEKTRHKATASEYEAFIARTQALGEIQQQKNKEIEARQSLIDKTIVQSYESSIKQLEAYHEANPNIKYVRINSVQDNNTCSGAMSEASKSTTGADTGHNGTEKATANTILDLKKAQQEIIQCIELINWSKSNAND